MGRKSGFVGLWLVAGGCFSDPGGVAEGATDAATSQAAETTSGTSDSPSEGTAETAGSGDGTSTSGQSSGTRGESSGSNSRGSSGGESTDSTSSSSESSESSDSGNAKPFCGDGSVDPDEACDGSDPANAACNDSCNLVCEAGFFDCNAVGDDGCEAEIASDGANCGGCGNVCLSESCADSSCEPAVIATDQLGGPGEILRSGDFIIWSEASFGAIRSWNLRTKATEDLVTESDIPGTHSFALVEDELYALDRDLGTIYRTSVDGSSALQFVLEADGAQVLAADASNLYFAVDQEVYVFPLDGGAGDEVLLFTDPEETICQLAATSNSLLWPLFVGADHRSISLDGSTTEVLDTAAPNPCNDRPQASAAFVYYLGSITDDGSDWGIVRYQRSDGTRVQLVAAPNPFSAPERFVVNENWIATVTQTTVVLYDLDGSNAVVVQEGVSPLGVYADAELVVWGQDDMASWSLRALEL